MAKAANAKCRAAVVGATGLAGQQFLTALAAHPSIEIVSVVASARSAGKTYREAISTDSGQIGWYGEGQLPPKMGAMTVAEASSFDPSSVDVVFSAVDAGPARELEERYAREVPVISTSSAFRYDDDVPVIIPGVNENHVELFAEQRKRRGWKGFVTPNPNCTVVGLATTLAPLHRAFGVARVHMVSMQAVSGAGRSPGVIALDIVDNIVPYIPKEEAKVVRETGKILGTIAGGVIRSENIPISATCTRVAVLEGHTEAVHVELKRAVSEADIRRVWAQAGQNLCAAGYPSCPERFIEVHDDPFRPQPRLDRDAGQGMVTSVGRLRADEQGTHGWQYVLVSHNTKMGAARGCVLLAEHLIATGWINAKQ